MAAAGHSAVSVHRRSLTTAAAAGAVLCALFFVPTAKAAPDDTGAPQGPDARAPRAEAAGPAHADSAAHTDSASAPHPQGGALGSGPLHRVGGVDSAPYAVGGLAFVALGAGGAVAVRSRRRREA